MLFYIGSTMERSVRAMDRLTFLDNGSPAFNLRDCVYKNEIARKLYAYEDTGLTPAEVVILKARSEKESFIDHLNMLCDMKDKQISELFHENQRLKKIISDIADIIRKEKD